ncbi:MAG: NADH-quinone oxidoreductase subunit J [Chloroflexi bacterium]|nr:NADH-quinone oxidoreductase subunit J [Chloroflexota bacterium]MBI1855897.1 NADH-quinone oxidoreductase subunit J [Chloroflexota bacterium]MBI3338644.1 NADH-quinone oxidoreductase subunit J [Chloroflexota bacterium]
MDILLAFYIITGVIMLLAAIAMVNTRNMVYSALYMVVVFLATAVLYLIYQAPLIAMIQITVYAGGIMVLFVFVIMLIGTDKMIHEEHIRWHRPLAFILTFALVAETAYLAVYRFGQPTLTLVNQDFGSPNEIGLALFQKYVLPVEVTSVLLLVAMVGTIVLAFRKEKMK